MEATINDLEAQPGRLDARDEGSNEWVVAAIAGERGPLGRLMLDGLLLNEPRIPIASFYGPRAPGDAHLFSAASKLFSALVAVEMLASTMAAELKEATGGQVEFAADHEFMHCLAIAKLARGLACGRSVAHITGTIDDKPIAEAMNINEALAVAYRRGVYFERVELRTVAPLSDRGHQPQTIGEAQQAYSAQAAGSAKLAQGQLVDPAALDLYEGDAGRTEIAPPPPSRHGEAGA